MPSALHNKILAQWTGHGSLESIEIAALEKWVQTHPYSASLQFLLAKKYALVGSPLFQEQVQKTTSYFPTALHLHQILQEQDQVQDILVDDHLNEKVTNLISEQFTQFKEPIETIELAYEAEIAIAAKADYFAAQGIEIDLSKGPQDKFTQQLRSFTAWLKVLKQKEGIPVMEEMAEENEKEIAAIAEKANTTADVITEAMAEIWLKQGNKRKAIDTYSKLSFIFPEKSVYFASRIEQIKHKK
jgi:DNA-binding SARP family transcriptional activator